FGLSPRPIFKVCHQFGQNAPATDGKFHRLICTVMTKSVAKIGKLTSRRELASMKRLIDTFFIMSLMCAGVWAQSAAQILGTVQDAGGGLVPGAQVTVTQTSTGATRTTQ